MNNSVFLNNKSLIMIILVLLLVKLCSVLCGQSDGKCFENNLTNEGTLCACES